jgi:hypothetical protein
MLTMTQDANFDAAAAAAATSVPTQTNVPRCYPPNRHPTANSRSIVETLLAAPVLAAGEKPEDFRALVAEVTDAVQPRTIFDRLLVNDLCHAFWEEQRFRRHQAALPNATRLKALQCLLAAIGLEQRALEVATDYFGLDEEERIKAIALVRRYGITEDAIAAQAGALHLTTLSFLERLTASRQSRRDMIVREYRRRQRKADKRSSRQQDRPNGSAAAAH